MANENDKPAMGEDDDNHAEPEAVEMTAEQLREELAREKAEKAKVARRLTEVNESDKKRRLRLEELEAAEEERKNSRLSEDEKAKRLAAEREQRAKDAEARAAKAEAALVDARIDHAVERAAAEAGFTYPSNVPRLIDRDRITFDAETGAIAGIKEAVERLAKLQPGSLTSRTGYGAPAAMKVRQGGGDGNGQGRGYQKQIDPFEQELAEMGRSGRM